MPLRIFLLLALGASALRCASGDALTANDLAKLDVRLKPVVLGTGDAGEGCGASLRADGTTVYSVLIRGNADELRAHGVPLVGTVGDVCTAVLTLEQMRDALHLPSVRSLDCGSTNTINSPSKLH